MNLIKLNQNELATIFLILTFPGFIAYQILSISLKIPPLPGVLSALGAIYILLYTFSSLRKLPRPNPIDIAFTILIATLILLTIANYILNDFNKITDATLKSVKAINFLIAFYLIGKTANLQSRKITATSIIFIVLSAFGATYLSVISGKLNLNPRHFTQLDGIISYQHVATAIMVLSLIFLSKTKGVVIYVAGILSSLIPLFLLGSRTELGLFIIGLAAITSFKIFEKPATLFYIVLIIIVTAGILLAFSPEIKESRHFQLIDYQATSTWQARQRLNDTAISQIKQSPVYGVYGGHVRNYDTTGSYAHNSLSVWVNYGAFAFFIYLGLLILTFTTSTFGALRDLHRNSKNIWLLALSFTLISLVGTIISKSFVWVIPGFSWGIASQALNFSRNNQ